RGDRLLDRARPPALHAARQGGRARLGLRHSPPRAGGARDGPLMFLAAGAPPEKTALVDDRVRLTWADLRRLAARVAGGLAARGAPDEPALLLYTSGTTAEPKGVLHSTATLAAECRATIGYHGLGPGDVLVMPSPVGHISGLLYGILLPALLGATSVLMETWDAERFCALVERERGTFSAGATPFLQGVVDLPTLDRFDLRSLRLFPCGGA